MLREGRRSFYIRSDPVLLFLCPSSLPLAHSAQLSTGIMLLKKKKSKDIMYIAQDPRTTPTLLCQYYCICIFLMRVPGDVFISFDYLPTVRLSQATPKMIFDFSKHEHTTFSPSPLAVDGASRTPSSPSSLPIQPRRYQYLLYTDQSVRTSLSASRRTGR